MRRKPDGTTCQVCGAFRAVGRNGRLPPHKCARSRPTVLTPSEARKVFEMPDDGLSTYIRNICGLQGY